MGIGRTNITAKGSASSFLIGISVPTMTSSNTFTYTGNEVSVTFNGYDSTKCDMTGTLKATNAGSYNVSFAPLAGYCWDDGSTNTKTFNWTIECADITAIPSPSGTLTYSGVAQSPTWNNYDASKLEISNDVSATNAGNYTAKFTPKSNYKWADSLVTVNNKETKDVVWSIEKATITAIPTQTNTLTYTGSDQTPTWSSEYTSTNLDIGGTVNATNAGTYETTFTPKSNYKWFDNTITAKTQTWTIGRKTVTSVPSQVGTLTYNESAQTVTWSSYVEAELTKTIAEDDTETATAAGTYTVTFTPTSNYKWSEGGYESRKISWVIAKGTQTMTVKIDQSESDPTKCCTYADDATSMTAGSSDWDTFFGIYPCLLKNGVEKKLNPNNFNQYEDGSTADITSGDEGDVMICFPRHGLNISTTNGVITVTMTDDDNDTNFSYNAHRRGSTAKDKFYVGAYTGSLVSNKLRSLSGKTPLVSKTIGDFRTYAQANGTGYEQLAFYQLTYIQAMYLLKYRTTDSQTAVGRGYVDSNRAAISTGGTETKGMTYGETTGKQHMKLFGMEDFWGNVYQWIDGLISNSSRQLLTATDGFNNTGSGYSGPYGSTFSSNFGNYMKTVKGTTEGGFVIDTTGGSTTTYWCDSGYLYASSLPIFGGDWNNGSVAGCFLLFVSQSASYSSSSIGGRLLYL